MEEEKKYFQKKKNTQFTLLKKKKKKGKVLCVKRNQRKRFAHKIIYSKSTLLQKNSLLK